ncbi:hypothetical protein PV11_04333 [Exophiala sideris]|uniref:Uncharacterized protein n=1 Tax=Exophiala sideris TaxID=1016849 RepID=A0A0D1X3P8_9EURO|nr:hypothetical protein PV11_04333 [Exophiala sideris]
MPAPQYEESAQQLRELLRLLSSAVETLLHERDVSPNSKLSDKGNKDATSTGSTSHAEYNAVKVIRAALGSLESLVLDPHDLLLGFSSSYLLSRALHIVAEQNVAEHLAQGGQNGLHVSHLANISGMEEGKLCRIMRALVSNHIFIETDEGRFANNHVSEALVGDDAFRAIIMMKGRVHYSASDFLPSVLTNPVVGHSYEPMETAFQQAAGTRLPLFNWLHEKVSESETDWRPQPLRMHPVESEAVHSEAPNQHKVPRPEKQLFESAMAGLGRSNELSQIHDFPWNELCDNATIVDVGAGTGSFCMQLNAHHPNFQLVIQDKAPVVEKAVAVWDRECASAVSGGRVTFTAHDFFKKNPVKNADVYWLRHILHDWADAEAIDILSCIRNSMGTNSRILIAEILMKTTVASDEVEAARDPLLANYGQAMNFAHTMDLNVLMMTN